MLKPTDITYHAEEATEEAIRRQAAIEAQFDAAILRAQDTGMWPATVDRARDGALNSDIVAVIRRFEAAGWLVDLTNSRYRAVINHPNRKQP